MRQQKTNTVQKIVNKAIGKKDFTHNLKNCDKRYIVSVKNIYLGFNPSLCYDLNLRIDDVINNDIYDSIGGWNGFGSNKSKPYYLDANVHFYSLTVAIDTAKSYGQLAIFDKLDNKIINI
jgi:hypothetical protein